jgi:serine/threonine protein kinase
LGDFGLSKRRIEATTFRSRTGTQSYMAPEIFHYVAGLNSGSSEYTNAADIWAIGCITYRIMTGRPPFPDLPSLKTYCSNIKLPKPRSMVRAHSLILLLLMPHPDDRLTATLALEHPWLKMGEQARVLSTTEVKQESIYAVSASETSTSFSIDEKPFPPVATAKRQVQFNYSAISHAAFHSNYQSELNQGMDTWSTERSLAETPPISKPVQGAFRFEMSGALDPEDLQARLSSLRRSLVQDREYFVKYENLDEPTAYRFQLPARSRSVKTFPVEDMASVDDEQERNPRVSLLRRKRFAYGTNSGFISRMMVIDSPTKCSSIANSKLIE